MNKYIRFGSLAFFGLSVAILSGCGPGGPKIVKVTGTVTHGGKPVPNVAITMTPIDGSRPSWGMADASGNFKMQYTVDQDGVIVGKHKVSVEFPPTSPQEENDIAMGKKQRSAEQKDLVKKYGDPAKSPYEIDITGDGKPVTLAFD